MRYERQEVLVNRDCPAVTVPYGSPVTIEEGCFAQITQQLGGSYTVLVEGNLYRVEGVDADALGLEPRSEEHTSELQSLMRISYAVFCLKKKNTIYKIEKEKNYTHVTNDHLASPHTLEQKTVNHVHIHVTYISSNVYTHM